MYFETSEKQLELLASSPLFKGANEEALQAALASSRTVEVPKGIYLFHQGEKAEAFYVLIEGKARLSQLNAEGHQVIIHFMGPGDGMAIIVVLSNTTYPLSAEAVSDVVALKWDYDSAIQLMESYPQISLNGLRLVANRFRELQDRYRELATERVEQRVARALMRLARQVGKRTDEGVLLDIPLSRQDLGEMTGTTLYTVSRVLSRWESYGLVTTGRERIVIRNPHGLVIIAEDLPPE